MEIDRIKDEAECELAELRDRRRKLVLKVAHNGFEPCDELDEVESKIAEFERKLERAKLASEEAETQARVTREQSKAAALTELKAK